MTVNLQIHNNEEEIQIERFRNESYYWQTELVFLNQEIKFYLDILNSSAIRKTNSKDVDANNLIYEFNNLKETNEKYQLKCEVFRNRIEGQNECDEVECDHAYIKTHLTLRSQLEKHFGEVRNIKKSAFNYLKGEIEKFE